MNRSLSAFLGSVIATSRINESYLVEARNSVKTYTAQHSTEQDAIADGIRQSCVWECYDRLMPTLLWDMKKGCVIAWNDPACNHPILDSLDGQCFWNVPIGEAEVIVDTTLKVERLSDDYFLVSIDDRPIGIV